MTLTTHAAIGAAIGYTVQEPALGFTLGFLSHFLVDMVPHGDTDMANRLKIQKIHRKRILAYGTVDALVACFLIALLYQKELSAVSYLAAVAGSILPDVLIGLYELTKTKYLAWFNKLHFFFHDFFVLKYRDVKLKTALAYQAIAVFAIIKYL